MSPLVSWWHHSALFESYSLPKCCWRTEGWENDRDTTGISPLRESEGKLLLSSWSTDGTHTMCQEHQGRSPAVRVITTPKWRSGDQKGCCKRLRQATKQKFQLTDTKGMGGAEGLRGTLRWRSLRNKKIFKTPLGGGKKVKFYSRSSLVPSGNMGFPLGQNPNKEDQWILEEQPWKAWCHDL